MDARLAVDSAVLLLYFVLIISIGLYMGRKEENLKDFALGGRRIPWWAVLASIIAAETSAGTFFGTPGEGFALRNYTYSATCPRHDPRTHPGQLHFHQTLLRLQRLFDLRISHRSVRSADEERSLSRFHIYKAARIRRALVCGSDRARPRL